VPAGIPFQQGTTNNAIQPMLPSFQAAAIACWMPTDQVRELKAHESSPAMTIGRSDNAFVYLMQK
jgi:hypothetical protein